MKIRFPYKCDYCLNPKGETNHWWLHPRDPEQFVLLVWDADLADRNEYEHVCSESCASKALSKWMCSQLSPMIPSPGSELAGKPVGQPLRNIKHPHAKGRVASILTGAG